MEVIFESSWMKIEKQDNEFKLIYDTGDHIGTIDEIIISKAEAIQAQQSDDAAYQVIIKYQNERMFVQESLTPFDIKNEQNNCPHDP